MSILVIGLFALAALLVLGGIDVTAAQLARIRLIDAADDAALDAADALDVSTAYGQGIGPAVVVGDTTVRQVAARNLATRPLPQDVTGWSVAGGTGTTDGHSATVVVTATVQLPLVSGALEALGRPVTITVESTARAPLRG